MRHHYKWQRQLKKRRRVKRREQRKKRGREIKRELKTRAAKKVVAIEMLSESDENEEQNSLDEDFTGVHKKFLRPTDLLQMPMGDEDTNRCQVRR